MGVEIEAILYSLLALTSIVTVFWIVIKEWIESK